jgi:hypothetical protein
MFFPFLSNLKLYIFPSNFNGLAADNNCVGILAVFTRTTLSGGVLTTHSFNQDDFDRLDPKGFVKFGFSQ